jgi:hypothetical protein
MGIDSLELDPLCAHIQTAKNLSMKKAYSKHTLEFILENAPINAQSKIATPPLKHKDT